MGGPSRCLPVGDSIQGIVFVGGVQPIPFFDFNNAVDT
jgi:hypothetical protein